MVSRKHFLRAISFLSVGSLLPEWMNANNHFLHGIASGDPLQNNIILWTRISYARIYDARVEWEIAENNTFTKGVQKGTRTVSAAQDFTVKIDVDALKPGTQYYYRFRYNKVYSPVGTTRTLPASLDGEAFELAVVACNNWEDGYFNAFRFLAEKETVDLVLHLGDYIYEYKSGEYGNPASGRTNMPLHEILTLSDYRQRYAHYRTDADLQRLHQLKPMIAVWDDHELANDAYVDGAKNNQPGEAVWSDRKAAAMKAYFEWMPVRASSPIELARNITIGKDISLLLMDQRLTGRTIQKPTDAPDFFDVNRSLLGKEQLNWLLKEMTNNNTTWQFIASQVMFTGYKVKEGFTAPKYNDWWLGYPMERNAVVELLDAGKKRNTVFLTGDHHQSFVLALHPDPSFQYQTPATETPLAWEFLTPSITSRNMDRAAADEVKKREAMLREPSVNPHLVFADISKHGYYIATITPSQMEIDYYFVSTILEKDAEEYQAASFRIDQKDFSLKQKDQDFASVKK